MCLVLRIHRPIEFNEGYLKMKKYVCDACGYVYDPAENNNIPFEKLPDNWTCPTCGVGKDMFSPM